MLVLNGPNLNLLGRREPDVYGHATLDDIRERLDGVALELSCRCEVRQSNDEATLIDWLHEAWDGADGVILNPAAFTHYSYAIRDAIAAISTPVVELHISNIHARETFRSHSVITAVALGMICGFGAAGYEVAMRGLVDALRAGRV
ncbi:MAG: type II 3-dehydroquinate dehydratase [Solirubrobacterales bacterium]|nr:type II 3-dehydroquinate dehydratase [Solirubrobacterales bacterium]MBV9473607.1 type II 3-dehydroquinate dehydratase [Solirubrobacterales bacterium]MBV9837376.1 type II 3-dehydroquinate dehydratase [Solirubrobacterales bacterium]